MQHCTNVSKKPATSLRPPSSVSLLAEQLKSSSLNETGGISSTWWCETRSDGFSDLSADRQPSMVCDMCCSGRSNVHNVVHSTGVTTADSCQHYVPEHVRGCRMQANDAKQEPVAGHTCELFGTSPFAASSLFSQGQSEPEEEDMDPIWRLKRSREDKTIELFQLYSASAPTTEAACTHYSSSVPSFNTSPSTNLPNPQQLTPVLKPLQSTAPTLICTCNAHSIPAKRACRSLSASASAQQQQQQHLAHHSGRAYRYSQLIEAHLFEAHFNTLPRPIAIRPVPGKTPLPDQLPMDSVNTLNVGCKPATNDIVLRKAKHREYSQGSRLSWHHPVFLSGLGGAKAQHPSYGVHFSCVAHATSSTCPSHSSVHSTSLGEPRVARSCKHQSAEAAFASNAEPCIQCGLSDSARMITSPTGSAFTPTHTRFCSPNQAIKSSECSPSPDVDLSAASSLQLPVPTPSSGFHEASFSCLSEASSLQDCSKMGSGQELLPLAVKTPHSKAIDTPPTVTRRDLCVGSSSCTETVERTELTESAIRCRSQPSEPGGSSGQVDKDRSTQESGAPRAVPYAGVIAAGLKRRYGPSMDTFNPPEVNSSSGMGCMDTAWCLSPSHAGCIRANSQIGTSPIQNDATLCRTGRTGSSYPFSGSAFTPSSWNSSAENSPFRLTNGDSGIDDVGGSGGGFGPEVFTFGSYSARSDWSSELEQSNGATIKRDSQPAQNQSNGHACPTCMLPATIQTTTVSPEEVMCMEESNGLCLHSSLNCAGRTYPGSEFEVDATFANCRQHHPHHTFPQLSELSESVEEDKEQEPAETSTAEDTRSRSDCSWMRAIHPPIKSPSMHEVTFAPIQLARDHPSDSPVVVDDDILRIGSDQTIGQASQLHCHSRAPMKDTLVSGYGNEQSGSGAELLLSLSPTDSDSSVDPDMLSPQLINRCKVKTRSLFNSTRRTSSSSSCGTPNKPSNPPCAELDLDLIEND